MRAFTLVEILAVIAIILVLVGMLFPLVTYSRQRSALTQAYADIAAMSLALDVYKADYATYPITATNRGIVVLTGIAWTNMATIGLQLLSNSACLYRALSSTNSEGKIYYKFRAGQVTTNYGLTYVVDPFNIPYDYYCTSPVHPIQANKFSFDLWSFGPDQTSGTSDDIANWKRQSY